MPLSDKRSLVVCSFPVLFILSGCGAKVECDSPEARSAVLKIISDDHTNALATYAARNSNVAKDGQKAPNSEDAKPLYLLGEKIVTTSTSGDKRTRTCSGSISVIVGDTKASKELTFTVQRPSGGQISVSVAPFQF
jgi:hypothetical protein